MSSTSSSPPADPAPAPVVPYGPGPADASEVSSPSVDVSAKSVGRTALKWGLRLALPFLLRVIFRGISGR